MIVYFTDKSLRIKGQAATGLPEGLQIVRDARTDEVETGTSSFEFAIHCPIDKWADAAEAAMPGNLCVRSEERETKLYQIIETTTDSESQTIRCTCEDSGLQLLGFRAAPLKATSEKTAEWYFAQTLAGTAFTVGDITVTGTKQLAWTEETTCVERLVAIAEAFGGELVYSCDIDKLGGTATATVGLTEKRGSRERQILYVGRQIRRLEERISAAGAATEILARGGIPAGYSNNVTLKNYPNWTDITETDDAGNVTDSITLDVQTGILRSAAAADRWGTTITRLFEGTALTQAGLLEEALADLRARRDVEREYDVELVSLAPGTEAGDSVAIVDDERGLYVEARLLSVTRSVTEDTWSATVGEASIKSSGISSKLEALAERLNFGTLGERRAYVHIAYASSEDGQTGFSRDSPAGKTYIGQYTDGSPEGSADPAAYTWRPVNAEQSVTARQLYDYPALGDVVTGGGNDAGGKMRVVDDKSRVIGEWGSGGLIMYDEEGRDAGEWTKDGLTVRDGNGNVIGRWNADGLKALNGQEWMQIKESVLTGGYGADTHGTLDLSAQTGTQNDVALKAENELRLEAGNGVVVRGKNPADSADLYVTGDLNVAGDAEIAGALNVIDDAEIGGTLTANPMSAMLKVVRQNIPVTPESIPAGAGTAFAVDIDTYVPQRYIAQAVLWDHASYYSYFVPTCISYVPGDLTADVRVRNVGSEEKTISYVAMTILCAHT